MLIELDITNLALVDHARISFGPGLNVLTGETGAGKSIVIDAVGLLVGGRADAAMIRSGADAARVEGFWSTSGLDLDVVIDAGLAGPDDDVLILSRELSASGRNVCRVNGRAVPLRLVEEIGRRAVDIHGQSAHLSLLRVPEQVELLDRWAGLTDLRRTVVSLRARQRRLRRELAGLRGDERELARRVDLLRHQIEEIGRARLTAGEEEQLRHDLRLQANAEELRRLAAEAHAAVGGEEGSARDLLGAAQHALAQIEQLDPEAAALHRRVAALANELDDLATELRGYGEGVEHDPEALAAVEERLGLIFALKRKYGASVEEVLAFADGAETELAGMAGRERAVADLEAEEAGLAREVGAATGELSAGRRRAAQSLEVRVTEQLTTLAMSGSFAVTFGDAPGDGAPEELEPVEFLLSLNPGEPVRSLAKVASGGETSRVMLAIKAALAGADPHPTLVFDEVDAGIGGRVAEVVGTKLADLARHSQVLAVTHLAQVAAFADVHLHVGKQVSEGRTVTRVTSLTGNERLDELSDMFGSDREAGRLQAASLLERSEASRQKSL